MSNNHLIARKIKKLLRLARTPGPEGERALERAQHLMRRHNLSVELEEMVRIPVHGVAGELWREQLLIAIAKVHRVAYTETTKAPRTAALHGEAPAVRSAIALYRRLVLDMAIRCVKAWRGTVAGGGGEALAQAERMWHRVFHLAAAVNLADRIAAVEKTEPKTTAEKPVARPKAEPTADTESPPDLDQRVADARKTSEEQLEKLAQQIGHQAWQLQQMAWACGASAGRTMDADSGARLPALPAESTFAGDLVFKVMTPEGRDPLDTMRPSLLEID